MVDSIPALVTTMTPAGDTEAVNERLVAYTGQTPGELKNWTEKLHPEDRAGIADRWRRSVETGDPYETDERVRRADGVYRWFHVQGLPMRAILSAGTSFGPTLKIASALRRPSGPASSSSA